MSEINTGAGSGSADPMPSGAAGGTPDESDLPGLQGLQDTEGDPNQGNGTDTDSHVAADARRGLGGSPGASEGSADPMPDMSGTGGG